MIKKYDGTNWNTKSYCKATTGNEAYSNFPIVVRSREQSISSWNMKGNEQHTGTPTPSNPVDVNGVGEKTANLFDVSTVGATPYTDVNGTPSANKGTLSDGVFTCTYGYYGSRIYINKLIAVTTGTYTFSADVKSSEVDGALRITKDDGTVIFTENYTDITTDYSRKSKTFTVDTDCSIRISLQGKGNAQTYQSLDFMFKNIMLVQGTATEYEPYGQYKIPILTTQGSANIYLSEPLFKIGDTTDNVISSGTATYTIAKHVFTGNEDIKYSAKNSGASIVQFVLNWENLTTDVSSVISTHLPTGTNGSASYNEQCIHVRSNGLGFAFGIAYSTIGVDDTTTNYATPFKTWLATQYANGTPLTAWYVLATPTTETVTAPTIPTTDGITTIDVNTTVKPSEMGLTYNGYHMYKPKKKSANYFDKDNATVYLAYLTTEQWITSSDSRSVKIPCKPNTQYTLSVSDTLVVFRIAESNDITITPTAAITPITVGSSNLSQYTFTTSADAACIIFQGSAGVVDTWIENLMLNEGSIALTYVPYWE